MTTHQLAVCRRKHAGAMVVAVVMLGAAAGLPSAVAEPQLAATQRATGAWATWLDASTLLVATSAGLGIVPIDNGDAAPRTVGVAELCLDVPPLPNPANRQEVALVTWRNEAGGARVPELRVVNLQKPSATRVVAAEVSSPSGKGWAAWSPDGTSIAYTATKQGAPMRTAMVMPPVGREDRTADASQAPEQEAQVPWRAIWVVDVATGQSRQLTDTPACEDTSPVFSADGRLVLFSRVAPERVYEGRAVLSAGPLHIRSIMAVDCATGEVTTLAELIDDRHPAPAPDGAHLCFVHREAGRGRGLYVADALGKSPVRLVSDALYPRLEGHAPVWSPDGQYVLFSALGDIHAAPRSGAKPLRLTTGAGILSDWEASPDCRRVVFRRGAAKLYTEELHWP